MAMNDVTPGKKVELQVYAQDVPVLREQGQNLVSALRGRMIQPQDRIYFQNLLLDVKSTKPKGMVRVMDKTAIKISLVDQPVSLACPQCGYQHKTYSDRCGSCGQDLKVVAL